MSADRAGSVYPSIVRESEKRGAGIEFAALLLLAALAALVLALSWNRWLEPVIDLGRDLYVPGAILEGKQLYRDILYFYPPTTPYLLAAVTGIIGSGLFQYALIGIASALVVAAALYLITRSVVSPGAAVAVTLLFVAVNVAGATTWGANFVFPYAHAATFAMMFFLLALLSLVRFLFVRATPLAGWSAMLFALLAASSKIEYIVATATLVAVAVVVYRFPWRYPLVTAGVALAALGALSLYFDDTRPGHHWLRDNVLPSSLLSGSIPELFYGKVSGASDLWRNLGEAALGALGIAAIAATLALIERRTRAVRIVALVLLAALIYFVAQERFYMAWTLVMPLLVIVAAQERSRTPLALLLAAAIPTASRVFFFLGPWWYGFVLIVPTYVVIAYTLFRLLPERRLYSMRTALLWLPLFAVVALRGALYMNERWESRSYRVETARGVYLDDAVRGAAMKELLGELARHRGASLAVMPEGLAINYFAQMPTPLSYQTFTPIEIANREAEERIVEELRRQPPDLIAVVTRDVREFGFRGFGIDYALAIRQEIRRAYRPVARGGDGRFGWVLLERSNRSPGSAVPD